MYRLLMGLIGSLLLASMAVAAPVTLYVAPAGNDGAAGTLAKPLGSVAGAQRAVRAARAQGEVGPFKVVVRGGTYRLQEPIVFGPEDGGAKDAPVVYIAMKGEKPVFTGGSAIKGWKRGEGGVWTAEVPEAKSGEWYFHQLFVNGERRVRARTPNEGYLNIAGPLQPLKDRKAARSDPDAKKGFRFKDEDVQRWAELGDVNVIAYHAWTASRHWIQEVDTETKTVMFRNPSGYPIGYWEPTARYYVENFRAALDSPGEWYLSRAEGRLYYWPMKGEDMAKAEVVAPRLQRLVEFRGDAGLGMPVVGVVLSGLSFQHAEWKHDPEKVADGQAATHLTAAVVGKGMRDCVLENCEIAHAGEYAVILGEGCKNNRIVHCEIHDLGGGGVRFGETSLPNEVERQASNNTVDNCFIHDGGHVFAAGIGVWIGRSSYNKVTHNEICDFYYSGCSVGWSWGYAPTTAHDNLFEYNHIHDIGKFALSDMGGIYSLGISPGTVERYNRIHDVYSYSYGGWGLYTDEGSSDIVLEKNIVYNTKSGGLHQHYGQRNQIRNNVFCRAWDGNILSSRTDLPNDLVFERNVVVVDNGRPLDGNLTPDRFTLRNNLYWDLKGNELDFYGEDLAGWQAQGKDAGSLIGNPFRKDIDDLDFGPDSPLHKIGFEPFDMSKCGLYGEREWVEAPKKIVRPPVPPPPAVQSTLVNDDFEQTKVGDLPAAARVSGEEQGASLRVTDETAAVGKHSLKFTDKPGLSQVWQPHMFYQPQLKKGTVRFAFSVRPEAGSILWHEWRDTGSPYKVGPTLKITNGELRAGEQALLSLPLGQWTRIEITCVLGKAANGKYDMTVTLPGAAPQEFKQLACGNDKFRLLDWVGFIAVADAEAVFYIDELKMEHAK
ncbi:MAG: right-handed parallel beta-helix repeat-containing protein [Armatimonadia bacterium]